MDPRYPPHSVTEPAVTRSYYDPERDTTVHETVVVIRHFVYFGPGGGAPDAAAVQAPPPEPLPVDRAHPSVPLPEDPVPAPSYHPLSSDGEEEDPEEDPSEDEDAVQSSFGESRVGPRIRRGATRVCRGGCQLRVHREPSEGSSRESRTPTRWIPCRLGERCGRYRPQRH